MLVFKKRLLLTIKINKLEMYPHTCALENEKKNIFKKKS